MLTMNLTIRGSAQEVAEAVGDHFDPQREVYFLWPRSGGLQPLFGMARITAMTQHTPDTRPGGNYQPTIWTVECMAALKEEPWVV